MEVAAALATKAASANAGLVSHAPHDGLVPAARAARLPDVSAMSAARTGVCNDN